MRHLTRLNTVQNLAIKFDAKCIQTVNTITRENRWVFPEDLVSLKLEFVQHSSDIEWPQLLERIFSLTTTLQYLHVDWAMDPAVDGVYPADIIDMWTLDSWELGLNNHMSSLRRIWTTDFPFTVRQFGNKCIEHPNLNEINLEYHSKEQAMEMFRMVNTYGNHVTHLTLISNCVFPGHDLFELTVGFWNDAPYEEWCLPTSRALCSVSYTASAYTLRYPRSMRPVWKERLRDNYAHLVWWRRVCLYVTCLRDPTPMARFADSMNHSLTSVIEKFMGIDEEHTRVHPADVVQQTRLIARQLGVIYRCQNLATRQTNDMRCDTATTTATPLSTAEECAMLRNELNRRYKRKR